MFSRRSAFGISRLRIASLVTGLLCAILAVLVFLPTGSRARFAKPSQDIPKKGRRAEFVPGEILVRYRSEVLAKAKQRTAVPLQHDGRAIPLKVERFSASDVIQGLRMVRVADADTLTAVASLREDPEVLYAEPNYLNHPDLTPNDPRFTNGEQASFTTIGAPTAWNTTTGSSNIVVGVIDEGIDITHPDLQANIWTNPAPGSIPGISDDQHGYDFANNSGTIPPGDHGTHVAGIIGAAGNNNQGVAGLNWQVKLMSLRTLGQGVGANSDSNALRAFTYAKQMRDLWVSSGGTQGANIRVLNASYGNSGSEFFSQAIFDAIKALDQSNILVVASEGNEAVDTDVIPHYPSGYDAPNLVSVAATNPSDVLSFISSFGAQTASLGAPGVGILSTVTVATGGSNPYEIQSGTSMATPHVAGAAALLLAQNPNLTVQQLKSLLLYNGDPQASLNGTTVTGRRLNVGTSMQSLLVPDATAPGTPTNFQVTSQNGRTLNLSWNASGDDGAAGTAALYRLSFVDSATGAVLPMKNLVPSASGALQTTSFKLPYGHNRGSIQLREFDEVGNEGVAASVNVSLSFAEANPFATTLGPNTALSTGGTPLNLRADDAYRTNYALPFPFPFFGTNYSSITISTNGALYFQTPSSNDSVSLPERLVESKMIAGLWDDLYLGSDQRADADVYDVRPNADTIIFRWQGVPCNWDGVSQCNFGPPVNFEIELKSNGQVSTRFGSGNTNLFPVVGVSGGEPDTYLIGTHTSVNAPKTLTNARNVTYIPRATLNPADNVNFFVSQHYRDFLGREPDTGGLIFWTERIAGNAGNNPPPCAPNDAACVNERRIGVSDAFFVEIEYQQTASYVFRMYRGAFGNSQPFPNPRPDANFPGEDLKLPSYQVFAADRALVIGGSNLAQLQLDYANAFVQRPSFISKYPLSLATADQFVDAVLATVNNDIHVDLSSQRANLITLYNSGGRGAVMYRLADDNVNTNPINNRSFIDAEYNRAFVFGEYSGYLRRNADIPGFMFWLGQVNSGPLRDLTKQHAMVCSFITSAEYQQRFSAIVSHNNTECN